MDAYRCINQIRVFLRKFEASLACLKVRAVRNHGNNSDLPGYHYDLINSVLVFRVAEVNVCIDKLQSDRSLCRQILKRDY
jgi:hypothetical protein